MRPNLGLSAPLAFKPFSLEFKPLLDEIATQERDLKELSSSFTRQIVKSWDAYKVTLTLVHRNPNPRSGAPSRYSVPPTPFYRTQQKMPAPRVSGLGGTCS